MSSIWNSLHLGSIFGVENQPTVVAVDPFNPKEDAAFLKSAMIGDGSNKTAIVSKITRRTSSQRQAIKAAFEELYNEDLVKELQKELEGKLEDVIVAMMTPMYDYLAKELNYAVVGLGTDEEDLVEIICSSSNEDLKGIKAAYKRLFEENLEESIKSDTSGDFRKLLIAMCKADRDEGKSVDDESAQKDVKKLLEAGALRLGTDEDTFTKILTKRSYVQLKAIITEYKTLSGRSLIEDIEKEFSDDENTKDGLIAIVKSTKNKPEFFAERLNKIVQRTETCSRDLIRIFVTRCEIDLGNIKQEYLRLYGKSLETIVEGDSYKDYTHILASLLKD